jgi:pantoate--beta-alanine ligase
MKIFETKKELGRELDSLKFQHKSIGFVPTMGALHLGHISLIKKSVAENDVTVASIFVNPTQFNDKNDLANYPRMLEKDIEMLKQNGCSILFAPSEQEMYPEPDNRKFDFGKLEKVMEGAHRPGHFSGVAQIVSKLFEAVPVHRAYFGEKDFQQVAIIRKLVEMLHIQVEIISCPIFRENDGLAMSSRNLLLQDVQRKNAPVIYQTLSKSKEKAKTLSVDELKDWVTATINDNQELQTEYFDIVDELTLQNVGSWSEPGNKFGCIAVKVGKIRLIDNIRY